VAHTSRRSDQGRAGAGATIQSREGGLAMDRKYVFITGGVVSSLGKGIATSSIGALLRARGYSVTAVKIDPYINVDAGTMRPYEHGEVFVTDDGAETDLDIGTYERFLDVDLARGNNVTTGQVRSEEHTSELQSRENLVCRVLPEKK